MQMVAKICRITSSPCHTRMHCPASRNCSLTYILPFTGITEFANLNTVKLQLARTFTRGYWTYLPQLGASSKRHKVRISFSDAARTNIMFRKRKVQALEMLPPPCNPCMLSAHAKYSIHSVMFTVQKQHLIDIFSGSSLTSACMPYVPAVAATVAWVILVYCLTKWYPSWSADSELFDTLIVPARLRWTLPVTFCAAHATVRTCQCADCQAREHAAQTLQLACLIIQPHGW